MDLSEECSGIESVEEDSLGIEGGHRDSNISGNDSCGNYDAEESVGDGSTNFAASPHMGQTGGSSPATAHSPGGSTSPMTKGYGLKKWRRIRRDVVKDGNMSVDVSKVLKRGFYGLGNGSKPSRVPLEIGKNKEASAGSTSAVANTVGVDVFTSPSALDVNFAAGAAFAAGADSDHSEDRSSKSSTAASAPKVRHNLPAAMGYARDRNSAKNLSAKGVGQLGKSHVKSSKNPREGRVEIQMENSHSSVESDLRTSHAVFIQGAFSAAGNGVTSGKSTSYFYSGNSDAAHQSRQHSEDGNSNNPKEIQDVENISPDGSAAWEAEEEKDENCRSSSVQDPLDQSMQALKSVQEALEKEVEMFGELAKEPVLPIAESQISNLMNNVKALEVTLEETRMTVQARELRICELEASLNNTMSPLEESASSSGCLTRRLMDEIESAFKQRIEAEIEYLAIVRTIQKLSINLQSQLMLLTEQEAAAEQKAALDRLGETETKASTLKKRAEELEKASVGILEAEEVLRLQKRTCKAASCLFLQLLLLVFVWIFVSHLSPQDAVVIPT